MSTLQNSGLFRSPPPLGEAFVLSSMTLNSMDAADKDTYTDPVTSHEDIEGEQSAAASSSALDDMSYDRLSANRYERIMADIESMMNAHDYRAAAQELVNMNIGDLPLSVFERFSDALDKTSTYLSDHETYLNAQLASQSLNVYAIQDIMVEQQSWFMVAEAVTPDISINAALQKIEVDGASPFPILNFLNIDYGAGIADEHNPQLNPNSGVVANFMYNQTYQANRDAALNNHDNYGRYVYSLDLKPF